MRRVAYFYGQLHEIREVFEQFDSDGGGSIDVDELRMAMRSLGQKMTKEEAQAYLDGIQVRRQEGGRRSGRRSSERL